MISTTKKRTLNGAADAIVRVLQAGLMDERSGTLTHEEMRKLLCHFIEKTSDDYYY